MPEIQRERFPGLGNCDLMAWRRRLNRWAFFATIRPERQKFDAFRIVEHSEIQKVPNTRNVNATYIWQVYVCCPARGQRRDANDSKYSLKLLAYGVGSGCPILPPPYFQFANMTGRETADLDR